MDIYKQAEQMDADYMDPNTGYIYQIQEYNRMKKIFGIDGQIRVTNSKGKTIGYARKSTEA